MEVFEDEHCSKILEELYEHHPSGVNYPIDNQCIQLLSQYGLILRPSSTGHMTLSGKQIYSYILQPETVKMLEKKLN